MKRLIVFITTTLLLFSCASKDKKATETKGQEIVDHELLEELCALERQYAAKYENKNQAQLDQICEL